MKKTLALAAAATLVASTAFAGGMAEPVMTMEPVMVMDESASSSSGLLILLALVDPAVSQSGGGI